MNRSARDTIDKGTGILIVLVLMALLVAPFAFLAMRRAAAEADIAALLDRYDRVRAVANADPSALYPRNAQPIDASLVMPEGPASVQTSALQARLREIADQRGLTILQASELTLPRDESEFERLGIRLEMSGLTKGIIGFLREIETAKPWLFTDNVQIRTGYADMTQLQEEPALSLGLDVWAVRLAPAPKSP